MNKIYFALVFDRMKLKSKKIFKIVWTILISLVVLSFVLWSVRIGF